MGDRTSLEYISLECNIQCHTCWDNISDKTFKHFVFSKQKLKIFGTRKSQILAIFSDILLILTHLTCWWGIFDSIFGIYRQFCIGNGISDFSVVKIQSARIFSRKWDSNLTRSLHCIICKQKVALAHIYYIIVCFPVCY